DHKKTVERWRDYFEKILTQTLPHLPTASAPPVLGPVQPIIAEAVKKIKPGKATGLDALAAEVWK
ncbi:hypothetical protein M9458_002048, partial [Cirrhinus mrigala]